ncbi:MAG: hypothetical protein QM270_11070 [Bacillota bacterium]|nr:hypothetical protein [Bacillota bacterium]
MKSKRLMVPLLLIFCLFHLSAAVSADMGPKPSVSVEITGLGEREAVITLLSESPVVGPYDADESGWSSGDTLDNKRLADIADEYFFLHVSQRVSSAEPLFTWSYYPPRDFKVLLLFDDGGCALSGPLRRTAFHACYTVDASRLQPAAGERLTLEVTARLAPGLLGRVALLFALPLILTLLAEVVLALVFGYRHASQLRTVIAVNLLTQLLLTLGLMLADYYASVFLYFPLLVFGEILVLLIEAAVYRRRLTREEGPGPRSRRRATIYAVVANLASLALGFLLALRYYRR